MNAYPIPFEDVSMLASTLLDLARTDGGATLNADGLSPDSGYIVGGRVEGLVIDLQDKDTCLDLIDPIRHQKLVIRVATWMQAQPVTSSWTGFWGSWLDDGKLYIDQVDVVSDIKVALDLGIERNQKAIYDMLAGEDIPCRVVCDSCGKLVEYLDACLVGTRVDEETGVWGDHAFCCDDCLPEIEEPDIDDDFPMELEYSSMYGGSAGDYRVEESAQREAEYENEYWGSFDRDDS